MVLSKWSYPFSVIHQEEQQGRSLLCTDHTMSQTEELLGGLTPHPEDYKDYNLITSSYSVDCKF